MVKKRFNRATVEEYEEKKNKKTATPAVVKNVVKNTIKAATEAKASSPVSTFTSNAAKVVNAAKQEAAKKAASGTKTTTRPTATYSPGSLYGKVVQDYLKQGMAFAQAGPQSRQQIANSLLGFDIGDYNKGDVASLNMDALREMQLRNQYYIQQHQNAGTFDDPQFLTDTYITLPGMDFLEAQKTATQAEIDKWNQQYAEYQKRNVGYGASGDSGDGAIEKFYSALEKSGALQSGKYSTLQLLYIDSIVNGTEARPLSAFQKLSSEDQQAEISRMQKVAEGADWESILNPGESTFDADEYKAQTSALQGTLDLITGETTRRKRLEELSAMAQANPNYGKPYTPPKEDRELTGNRVLDAWNAVNPANSKWNDKTRFIVEWNAYRESLNDVTDPNAFAAFMRNFSGDVSNFFGYGEEVNAPSTTVAGYIEEALHYMTPDMVEEYKSLLDEDPALAEEYLEVTRPERLRMKAAAEEEYYTTRAEDPLYATIDTLGTFPKNVAGTINTVLGALAGEKDPNAAIYGPAREVSTTRQVAGQTAGELFPVQIFGEEAGTIAYNVFTSIGDMMVAKKIGGVVGGATGKVDAAQKAMGVVMATESGTNTYLSDLQEGKDPLYAALHGIADGSVEAWSESGFIDSLFDDSGKFLARVWKSASAEGLEEIVSEGGQMGVDLFMSYLTGQQSEIEKTYKYYEATLGKEQAATATLQHYANNFAIAGMSGFATGGGVSAVTNTTAEIDNRATGKAIQQQGDPERVLEIAKGMPESSKTYAVAKDIEARVGKGKKMTLGQLGKLTMALDADLSQEYADITNRVMEDAIANRLVEVGSSSETAKRNAPAIRKMVFGEKLTMAEMSAVAWDANADQVTKELSRQMQESENTVEGAPTAEPEGMRTGQKWVTAMKATQIERTGEVMGKQVRLRSAATTKKNVSTTVAEAAKKGADKAKKGKDGKPVGKTTARKVYYTEGDTSGEGEILRFEEQDGALKMVIQTGKTDKDTATVALDSLTEADGAGTAGLIEAVKDINDNLHKVSGEEASAMLAAYGVAGGDVARFVESYETSYLQGYSGLDAALPATDIDPKLAQMAMESGKRQAEKDETARKTRASAYKAVEAPVAGWLGKVENDSQVQGSGDAEALSGALEGMTESQRMTAETAIELGEAVGLNVVLFESDPEHVGSIQNGSFDASTHTVYLDVNAGTGSTQDIQAQKEAGTLGYAIMRTMGHELTHYLEAASPEMYAKYKAAVTDALKAAGQDMAVLIRGKIDNALSQGKKLSYNGAVAEVIADASEYMLQDSKFTTKLDATLRGKVKTFVQNFMQKVKDIFRNLTSAHKESAALREVVDGVHRYTGQLQELWDASLQEVLDKGTVEQAEASADQSGEAAEMVEGGVRYSDRNENSPEQTSIKAQIREIQEELNGMDVVASVVAPDLSQMNAKQRKNWVMGVFAKM